MPSLFSHDLHVHARGENESQELARQLHRGAVAVLEQCALTRQLIHESRNVLRAIESRPLFFARESS